MDEIDAEGYQPNFKILSGINKPNIQTSQPMYTQEDICMNGLLE